MLGPMGYAHYHKLIEETKTIRERIKRENGDVRLLEEEQAAFKGRVENLIFWVQSQQRPNCEGCG